MGGDELADGAEGAGEGGLGGALRFAQAAEQEDAKQNRGRLMQTSYGFHAIDWTHPYLALPRLKSRGATPWICLKTREKW